MPFHLLQYTGHSPQEVSRFPVLNDMRVTSSVEDVTVRSIQSERNLHVTVYLNNEPNISLTSEWASEGPNEGLSCHPLVNKLISRGADTQRASVPPLSRIGPLLSAPPSTTRSVYHWTRCSAKGHFCTASGTKHNCKNNGCFQTGFPCSPTAIVEINRSWKVIKLTWESSWHADGFHSSGSQANNCSSHLFY